MPAKKKQGSDENICWRSIRLPRYLNEQLQETNFYLKRSNPSALWSQNKIVCEALRSWLIAANDQLKQRGIMK